MGKKARFEPCRRYGDRSGVGGAMNANSGEIWQMFSVNRHRTNNVKLFDHGHPLDLIFADVILRLGHFPGP